MAKHILLVLTNAADGRDKAFNEWYDKIHIREVLALPGFLAAQRFQATEAQLGQVPSHRYLAIYEFESDNPAEFLKSFSDSAKTMTMTDATDGPSTAIYVFTEIGPRQTDK